MLEGPVRFPRRINGLLSIVAMVGMGCGVSQELYNLRTTELDRCQGELARTRTQMAAARAKSDELTTEAGSLRDRITAREPSFGRLGKIRS